LLGEDFKAQIVRAGRCRQRRHFINLLFIAQYRGT
jgi:hypothetical protein